MAKQGEDRVAETAQETQQAPVGRRLPASFKDLERILEGFVPRRWPWSAHWDWPAWPDLPIALEGKVPKMDVIERDNEVVVRAEVPGIDKKDLDVSVTDNSVTVKGETSREEKKEEENYYRCEISRGGFSRTVSLPSEVDGTKAKASFKEGLLELVIPKQHKSKRHRVKLD